MICLRDARFVCVVVPLALLACGSSDDGGSNGTGGSGGTAGSSGAGGSGGAAGGGGAPLVGGGGALTGGSGGATNGGSGGTAGANGAGGTANCPILGTVCANCRDAHCAAEFEACKSDTTCSSAHAAAGGCMCLAQANSDSTALQQCVTTYENANAVAKEHIDCIVNNCATECGL